MARKGKRSKKRASRKRGSSSYKPSYKLYVQNIGNLFPRKVRVMLPYNTAQTEQLISVGGGTPGGHWFQKGFSINDATTVDPASTSHQPRGWNQWATMFDSYYIVGVTVRVKVTRRLDDAITKEHGVVCVYQSRRTVAEIVGTSAYYDNLERMRDPDLLGVWKRMDSKDELMTALKPVKFYTRYADTVNELEDFTGPTDLTSPPPVVKQYHVFIRYPESTASTHTVLLETICTYDVIFTDPKNVTGS